MSNITIRLAIPADAPDMAEVCKRSWEAAYAGIIPDDYIREKNAGRPALFARIITDENNTQHVIQADGKTVGIMGIDSPRDKDLGSEVYELQSIYLHPDCYRQGIGAQAMEFVSSVARNLGKTAITVWLLADNLNARAFYEKCGFTADGSSREKEYGKMLTSIRMRKEL